MADESPNPAPEPEPEAVPTPEQADPATVFTGYTTAPTVILSGGAYEHATVEPNPGQPKLRPGPAFSVAPEQAMGGYGGPAVQGDEARGPDAPPTPPAE